jgi:putative transposase
LQKVSSKLLKRVRIRRKIYKDREEARRDVFDSSDMFYKPKRRHGYSKRLSPIEHEKQYEERITRV